jgi:hypothetical protein
MIRMVDPNLMIATTRPAPSRRLHLDGGHAHQQQQAASGDDVGEVPTLLKGLEARRGDVLSGLVVPAEGGAPNAMTEAASGIPPGSRSLPGETGAPQR